MNRGDKERIALKLIEMAKATKKFLSSDENKAYPAYHSDFLLVSSFDEEREEILVNLLNDQVYAAKFSEEYLEKLLKAKVSAMMQHLRQQEPPVVRPQKIAREIAEAIFHELDSYTTNLTIYWPVTGINLQLEEGKLELGNITLQTMTQERIDEVLAHITGFVLMNTSYTQEGNQRFIKFVTEELQRSFKEQENPIYAVYQIVAEPIQAEKRTKEECYQVFDLLRYALPMISTLYPMRFSIPERYIDNDEGEVNNYVQREQTAQMETGKSISFGLESEIGAHTDIISTIIILRDELGFNWKSSRKERPLSLPIDAHIIEGLKIAKVFEASQIIKKGKASQTNFERTILRSIHWFANAQTPMQPEYVLLSLMSSIEAFLNPPGEHERVTVAITEGVAALGGKAGYKYTKKRIEQLYDKRSALSHGDDTEIVERDISELRAVAFYLIHRMIQSTDEFSTQEELYEDVKRIREEIKQNTTNIPPTNDL